MAPAEGVLASSIVKAVLAKFGSSIWGELALLRSFRSDLKATEDEFGTIRGVLADAEARGGGGDSAVRDWLRRLKDLAHEIDDFLDACHSDLRAARRCRRSRGISACGSTAGCCILHSVVMAHRLRSLRRKLDVVAAGRDRLRLDPNVSAAAHPAAPPKRETISMVDEAKTVGRAADKEKLMKLVLDLASEEDVSVIPIVGFGGLGKTTLAQLVFNDRRANDEVFDPRIWVSMSVDFSLRRLIQPIVSATKLKGDLTSLEAIAKFLSETFTGKKYLLVLDDVWSESQEEWERLKLLLKDGKRGSKIIVTTRSRKVGMMVRTVPPFVLKGLSDDDCWELFKGKAFEEGEDDLHPKLVKVGKEIVRKCGGVPLAAKALGSMLRFKRNEESWIAVKDSEIWQLDKEDTILPSLKLTYDQMPPGLKQCFAYCASFPRNHEIDRDKLIQQWIALGFIEPANLALPIATSHLRVLQTLDLSWNIGLEELPESIGNLHSLKELILFQCWNLRKLPESITSLVMLESLSLVGCADLAKLPDGITTITNLKHLRNDECRSLERLPDGFGQLTKLETLSLLIIGDTYSSIAELKDLNLLTGFLKVECCSQKKDLTNDAKRANLRNKRKLGTLTVSWTSSCSSDDLDNVETFLEVLLPPENLEVLEIYGYMGTKFPSWMMNSMESWLPNITSLSLGNIPNCICLPPLGHVPHLQSLELRHMSSVHSMGSEILIKGQKNTLYQSLKELHFEDMPDLEIWPTSLAMDSEESQHELLLFPVLKTVTATGCPKMRPNPCLPDAIADLSLSNSSAMLSVGRMVGPSKSASLLRRLWITNCHGSSKDWNLLQHRPKLEDLTIEYCGRLHILPEAIRYLSMLRKLKIDNCTDLEALPEWLGDLTALEHLEISCCQKLVSLPEEKKQARIGSRSVIYQASSSRDRGRQVQHICMYTQYPT
ncbi:unnamed protein product [Alopecurus aequalis]